MLARRALAVLAVLLPLPAQATGTAIADRLSAGDRDRLAAFESARAEAIATARAGGGAADLAALQAVLAGDPRPILGVDIRGDYRCRSAQLGGILPVVVYGWFKCRIDEDDAGTRIVKTTGSQRFTGRFIDADPAYLVFWGAGHYADERPRAYGDDPERDMVGRFVKVGATRYRLELPLPKFDSRFEIIELERR